MNWARATPGQTVRVLLDGLGLARRWLSRDGVAYAEALGLSPERVESWVAGLEPLSCEQLTFNFLD